MTYQQFVTWYPPLAMPGEPHSDTFSNSSRSTGFSTETVFPGTLVEITGFERNSRLVVANVTGATTDVKKLAVVDRTLLRANNPYESTRIGQLTPATEASYSYAPNEDLTLMRKGRIYVLCEKAIDTSLPVYVRLANPVIATPQLEGIGFVTDTADGADTLELTNCQFAGGDSYAYISSLDPSITDQQERDRMSLTEGYGVVPIEINFIL